MKYNSAIEELGAVSSAMMTEREDELAQFKEIQQNKSIKERTSAGVSVFPLKVVDKGVSFGSYPFIELKHAHDQKGGGKISNGSSVNLFRTAEDGIEEYLARVLHIGDGKIKLLVYNDELPDQVDFGNWGIDLMFDDKSYETMAFAMSELINSEDPHLTQLRDVLLGYKSPSFKDLHPVELPQLNESQNKAVNLALSAEQLGVIHGPPGTGKTTTVVELVTQLHKKEKQVLVCSPSNTATDVLTTRLADKGLKVVRIGNSPKIEEQNKSLTINQLIRNHSGFKKIKEYHKRADEMHKMASKYKRSFGKEEREQRKLLYRESREFRNLAKQEEKHLISTFLDEADVIACTLVGSYDIHLKGKRFQTVIIDEAGQGLEPATWIPILKADRVIFSGDPMQLPPTVRSRRAAKMGFETTLIEKCIERQAEAVQLLNVQYRMNQEIMQFSSDQFYGGELSSSDTIAKAKLGEESVIEWIDTAGCGYEESSAEKSGSRTNPGEAELLKKHLNQLLLTFGDQLDVGIISPYRAQVELIKEMIEPKENLVIQTIDGFQGQEKDVIYISLVRSNAEGNIGFLSDRRRMNVAMTRAKKKLVIIGDSATIGNDSFYNAFLDYIESINAYHSAWEWM